MESLSFLTRYILSFHFTFQRQLQPIKHFIFPINGFVFEADQEVNLVTIQLFQDLLVRWSAGLSNSYPVDGRELSKVSSLLLILRIVIFYLIFETETRVVSNGWGSVWVIFKWRLVWSEKFQKYRINFAEN